MGNGKLYGEERESVNVLDWHKKLGISGGLEQTTHHTLRVDLLLGTLSDMDFRDFLTALLLAPLYMDPFRTSPLAQWKARLVTSTRTKRKGALIFVYFYFYFYFLMDCLIDCAIIVKDRLLKRNIQVASSHSASSRILVWLDKIVKEQLVNG
jgi:hypothetical protein